MAKDRRLLGAIVLFICAAIAAVIQAAIVQLYIYAAVMGSWAHFAETFGVKAPPNGPDVYCLDYCVADLPFVAGWISVASFLSGLALVVRAWWKPDR